MAEVLEQFPPSMNGKHRGRVGFSPFMDGKIYRIVNGTDFHCKNVASAKNGLYLAASRRALTCRISVESENPITLVVQATPKG